ncbi:MAG TPA: hypothetical protein VHN39_14960 [Phenylobacterium sp.]|jgi:hypothetical protein|nr:hypothetical protein [Phenylobacterium sp.]
MRLADTIRFDESIKLAGIPEGRMFKLAKLSFTGVTAYLTAYARK